jgi:PAS domain S-box-containing protein
MVRRLTQRNPDPENSKRRLNLETTKTHKSKLTDSITASERLAAIVDSSDDAIISKDLTGIVQTWNAAATRIFGYTAEEMIGESIRKLIPSELQSEEDEVLRKLCAGERIDHYETERLNKDGSRRYVSLTISPLRDVSGKVIGASKIARDISERRASARARFHLAAIVDSSDDAIVSKDLDGIIQSWNHAAEALFGWKPEEIIGRSVLELIPEELQSEEPEILAKLRAGTRIEHYETTRLHKNGDRLDVSLTISPIKDPEGRVIGASKIARDIFENKRMQQTIIDSEKLAATGRMAAAIAHEINNPLEAVTNLAYLLSMDETLNDTARSYAQLMLDEISRAAHITKQTLAFYRDSTRPEPADLAKLMDNVLQLNAPRLKKHSIEVEVNYENTPTVFSFASELRQVFANMIQNAIDAIGSDGKICIHIGPEPATKQDSPRVRVTIADNGPGIPKVLRHRLFQPFFTTKGSGGNGLGLWVSHGIVTKHRGVMRLRSRTGPDSGTTFSILLPVAGISKVKQVA